MVEQQRIDWRRGLSRMTIVAALVAVPVAGLAQARGGRAGGQSAAGQQGAAGQQRAAGGGDGAGRGGGSQWRERTVVRVAAGPWTGPRLLDGQPDVQGHWSNTIANHNGIEDPQGGDPGTTPRGPREERAPSRVSDPPDGRVPLQPWAKARQQEFLANFNEPVRPEYVDPMARCAPAGPSRSLTWHGFEIRQYPGYVVLFFNGSNRIIHLDSKPHVPQAIKLWNGDSRGRWEGNTLIVDVKNNNSKWRFARTGEFVSDRATIVERWTFSADRFIYDATYTDPTVLTRPFTITIPVKRVQVDTPPGWDNETMVAEHDGKDTIVEMWERSCVEGNAAHGMTAEPASAAPGKDVQLWQQPAWRP
jgi:hypothetical protein